MGAVHSRGHWFAALREKAIPRGWEWPHITSRYGPFVTRIMIIVGSVREGRKGIAIADWVRSELEQVEGVELDFADLKEIALPLMDEPNHPRLKKYTHQHTIDWSQRVEAADAFILVAPEYNFAFTAPVKNAFDYLSTEWARKAIGFVSYGGVSAGTRSVAGFQVVVTALGLVKTQVNVEIPAFTQFINDEEEFVPNEILEGALKGQIAELVRLDGALRTLRA